MEFILSLHHFFDIPFSAFFSWMYCAALDKPFLGSYDMLVGVVYQSQRIYLIVQF